MRGRVIDLYFGNEKVTRDTTLPLYVIREPVHIEFLNKQDDGLYSVLMYEQKPRGDYLRLFITNIQPSSPEHFDPVVNYYPPHMSEATPGVRRIRVGGPCIFQVYRQDGVVHYNPGVPGYQPIPTPGQLVQQIRINTETLKKPREVREVEVENPMDYFTVASMVADPLAEYLQLMREY